MCYLNVSVSCSQNIYLETLNRFLQQFGGNIKFPRVVSAVTFSAGYIHNYKSQEIPSLNSSTTQCGLHSLFGLSHEIGEEC
jgi:hypothetical protein